MVSTLVEHEYIATEDDELTINPGDIITEVVKQEGGWWEGVLNGKKGVFPENFVKEIKVDKPPVVKKQTSVGGHVAELASKLGKAGGIKMDAPVKKRETSMKKLGRAKVVFSYTPQNEDELGLEVDTIVDVTTQVEEGWWEGVANGKTGLFPSNFVELLDEEPETEKIVQAKKVVGVGLGNIFGNSPITLRSQGVQPVRRQDIASSEKQDGPELKNKKGSPRDVPASPRDVPTEAPVVANKEPKETKRVERAKVLYSYKAENEDELSIEPGQVITVLCKSLDDSGWWKGELSGNVGVFPDNFVELLPEEVSKPKKPPPPLSALKPSSTESGKSHVKEVQDEKPAQSHKGKHAVPPPVGKKPMKRTDPALLAQTDDNKANLGHVDLAKNGVEVADKPTAQVKGRVTHQSSSADNFHDQSKDDPKNSPLGHRTSRVPPPMPKEPPTTLSQKSPRSPMTVTSPPPGHSKSASKEVAHAAPPADSATGASPALVESLQREVEQLKATSVSAEKHEALQAELAQLREEFLSLKSKMNARITDLMDEVDDEKKIRLTMQVEIERIRKLTKPT